MNCKKAPERDARITAICASARTQSPGVKGIGFLVLGTWLVLLVGFAIYIFYGVANFYFTGDDFTYFWSVTRGNAFLINPDVTHYQPVGEVIAAFPAILTGPNPLFDNIFLVLFYLIATGLTVYICDLVTGDLKASLIAGFLFLTFSRNHELMFWKTGRITSAMAILCLLSFLSFYKYLVSRKRRFFLLSNCLLLVALFTTEQACFFVPVWAIYELMYYFPVRRGEGFASNAGRVCRSALKYVVPLGVIALVFSLKIFRGQMIGPKALHLQPLLEAIVYGIFDYNHLLSSSGILSHTRSLAKTYPGLIAAMLVIVALGSVIGSFLRPTLALKVISKVKDPAFFLLWAIVTYLPLSVIMGSASRYLALASSGISALVAILLTSVGNRLGKPFNRFQPFVTEPSILLIALLISVPGIRHLTASKSNWAKASEIEQNLVESFRFYTKDLGPTTQIYLINVPDRLLAETSSFFIARNGFRAEMLYYRRQPATFVTVGIPVRPEYPPVSGDLSLSSCEATDLAVKPDSLVLVFDPSRASLTPWDSFSAKGKGWFVVYGDGFQSWEFSPDAQLRWRWTTDEASLKLDVRCYPERNRIRGMNIELGGFGGLSLPVVIGAHAEDLARLVIDHPDLRPYTILFSEEARRTIADEGQLVLRIRSETWRPSDLTAKTSDTRLLGVAVGSIELIE